MLSRRSSGLSESASQEGEDHSNTSGQEESEGVDEYYTNKKHAAKRKTRSNGRSLSKQHTKNNKKLRRAGQEESDDLDDAYAIYGNRNAPRARREDVNYDENNAYDSMLSDEITDPEDKMGGEGYEGHDTNKRSGAQQGDAIDGIYDHKRSPDHGKVEGTYMLP